LYPVPRAFSSFLLSGFVHSAYSFGNESIVTKSNIATSEVSPGALINFLQKGLMYQELEQHVNEVCFCFSFNFFSLALLLILSLSRMAPKLFAKKISLSFNRILVGQNKDGAFTIL
jgi:hypothetical protein